LNAFGQTINIMTLGGLALAVGILVDEATVTIENIHRHFEFGKPKARAILDGCKEIVFPKLLILFSILAVFTPSFFMSGVPRGMFMPMAMAVGFAMIASFILSMTFVPVMAVWMMKHVGPEEHAASKFYRFKTKYLTLLGKLSSRATFALTTFFLIVLLALAGTFFVTGVDIFPKTDAGQAQVRLRMKPGTRLERTEEATQKLLQIAGDIVGKENIAISSAFVGTQPSSYPVNLIHLWTNGPHESVTKINLTKDAGYPIEQFKEELRKHVKEQMPEAKLSFEPGDMVDQVLNLGSTNPIELAIVGKDLKSSTQIALQLEERLKDISYLRDVQIATPMDYPGLKINIDRVKSGQLGVTVKDIAQSMVTATSSSRFTTPNYWRDPVSGNAYQVQVEYPQHQMNSAQEIEMIPIVNKTDKKLYLGDVASWSRVATPGEYDRLNQQRFITLTANIHDIDLGGAVKGVNQAIAGLGQLPQGVKIIQRGQVELLSQTMGELQNGLLIAIAVIFLMLAANFQSFRVSVATLSIVPAVMLGSFLLLLITGYTLNIQSYMGAIMAIGVAIANAILYITNAEDLRKAGNKEAHKIAASNRIRPILMTSFAMVAGMLPMALGIGEGGDQIAPLGVAVIGGLLFSMITTLLFLPMVYQALVGNRDYKSRSLNPNDHLSKYFDNL
jgi:multidrug efflux pump subunit AcrB